MKKELTDYDKQAQEFIDKTGLVIDKTYKGHRKYFDGDTNQRAVFNITFTRKDCSFSFEFGNSIQDSYLVVNLQFNDGKTAKERHLGRKMTPQDHRIRGFKEDLVNGGGYDNGYRDIRQDKTPPSNYDILSCIEKNNPGTFEDFCDNYDCNTDSRKDMDLYFKVQKEWSNISRLFTDDELMELQKIQ